MERIISLPEIFQALRKRILLIVGSIFLFTTVSGVISYNYITPTYEATTQLLINQANSEQSIHNVGEIEMSLQLINTYNVIIKSPAILDLVREELNMKNISFEEFNSKITVGSVDDSQVVTISVQDADPMMARDIANTTANIFQREITNLMNVENNVNILAKATASADQSPVKPNPVLNMALAAIVGVMIGAGIAFLLEYMDRTIKTVQEIESYLGISVIGTVSSMDKTEQKKSFWKWELFRKGGS